MRRSHLPNKGWAVKKPFFRFEVLGDRKKNLKFPENPRFCFFGPPEIQAFKKHRGPKKNVNSLVFFLTARPLYGGGLPPRRDKRPKKKL